VSIAVTAASGRLGHAVLAHLGGLHPPADTVAVVRDPARLRTTGVDVRRADYASVADMTVALRGVHTVVMISAPVVSGTDRVALHRNVMAAAREAGVSRLVFSSIASESDESTLYFPTQQINRDTEAVLRSSGLAWTVLRNALYLDLDIVHIFAAGAEGAVYSNPGGDGRASYLTIDELAYATAKVAVTGGHEGKTYNLTGDCVSQAELVRQANEVFGFAVRYEPMSDEASIERFMRLMPHRGMDVARMLTGCFQAMRKGHFDLPSHFEAAAGRPPKSLRAMLEDCRARRR